MKMETADRIIIERLLQERRSQAAAERLVRQARHAASLDGHPRVGSRPAETAREMNATVDSCGVPQRAA
jgi:hypothetical protein